MADFEWKIAKAGPCCSLCQAAFAEGQTYYSALIQQPEVLLRQDYCQNCFQERRPEHIYYFWKTTQPSADTEDKKGRQRIVVDVDYVFDFFKRLEGDSAPQKIAFRYILALMLTRKKLLVADTKKKDANGADVHVFKEKRGGLSHQVVEPQLSEDEVASVSAELGVLLGLAPPPQQPQPVAETATTVAEASPQPEQAATEMKGSTE